MWLQWDWGEGPRIGGRRTQLLCCWLAWSRFRVVLPSWDQSLGSLTGGLDRALRVIGGAPAYLLTDNAKTVTVEHVAGIPVRHPDMVALGRHYGCTVQTCRPFDPESKGGTGCTVKIAKADLVPAEANLAASCASFGELEVACEQFCDRVNGRVHRESAAVPAHRLVPLAGLALGAYLIMFAARAIPVYGLLGLVDPRGVSIPWSWRHMTMWGGLRGALSVASASATASALVAVRPEAAARSCGVCATAGTIKGRMEKPSQKHAS